MKRLLKNIFIVFALLSLSPTYSSESPEANSELITVRSLAEFKHEMLGESADVDAYKQSLEDIQFCLEQTNIIDGCLSEYLNALRTAIKICPKHGTHDSFSVTKGANDSKGIDKLKDKGNNPYIIRTSDGFSAAMQIMQIGIPLDTTKIINGNDGEIEEVIIDMRDQKITAIANYFIKDSSIDVSHVGATCVYSAALKSWNETSKLNVAGGLGHEKFESMQQKSKQLFDTISPGTKKVFSEIHSYDLAKTKLDPRYVEKTQLGIKTSDVRLNLHGHREIIFLEKITPHLCNFYESKERRQELYELIAEELLYLENNFPGIAPEAPQACPVKQHKPTKAKDSKKKKSSKGHQKHHKSHGHKSKKPKQIIDYFDDSIEQEEPYFETTPSQTSSVESSPRDNFEIEYEIYEETREPEPQSTSSTIPLIPSKCVKLEERVFKYFRKKMELSRDKKAGSDKNIVDHSLAFDVILKMLGREGIRVKYRNRTYNKFDTVYALPCEINYKDGSKPRHGLLSMALDTEDGDLYRVYHYGFSEKPVEELINIGFTKRLIYGLTKSESNEDGNLGYRQVLEEMYEPEERKKFLFHLPVKDFSTVVSESKFTRTINDPTNNSVITVYRPATGY